MPIARSASGIGSENEKMRVGIEVGGTFTDLVAVDGDKVVIVKVPSTPRSPDIGALNSIRAAELQIQQISDLAHGSTVATNAILERKGARLAFVATRGFRDILFLQRHDRRNIYDLRYKKPAPVVERQDCYEVRERVAADGEVVESLDENDVLERLVPALRAEGYAAVAVCLLSAYAHPQHEERLKTLLQEALPGVFVTGSTDVSREFREYERSSTTTLSAFVQPVIDSYLERLSAALSKEGFAGHFSVMQSNGGRLPAEGMRRNAISALFSGPAAGVVGAIRQAGRSGVNNLISFDMGGTSTDVCLVADGKPGLSPETEIDGLPIRTPILDIATVGAGGGSIVWIDDGGMLRVGPQSAGAEPGPACYGRGGKLPTITDAHVIRGSLRPETFLGGTMALDPEKAREAFSEVAATLNMSVEEAAASALRLAAANIVRAIQLVSTERGKDPRDYALVPFGGAGPLLAAEIADELGIKMVLVPPNPGVISAFGLLAADYSKIDVVSRRQVLNDDAPKVLREAFSEMRARLASQFEELGLGGKLDFTFSADMRFVGQAFEISVDVPVDTIAHLDQAGLARRFAEAHQQIYFHSGQSGQAVEIVGFRLHAAKPLELLPAFTERASTAKLPEMATIRTGNGTSHAVIRASHMLKPGGTPVVGPALIEGYSSTIFLPSSWAGECDESSNIILRKV
jgi:N-methylhydantoinase A